VCRISVSPRGPPKIGAHPLPRFAAPSPASRPPPRCAGAARSAAHAARNPTPATLPPPRISRRARRVARGGTRAASGRAEREAGRPARGARRAQAHPRYAAPSLVRGRRTDARSALPDGPRAGRGRGTGAMRVARRNPTPATLPPPRRAGGREVGFRYADRIWGSGLRNWRMRGRGAGSVRPRGARSRAARAQPLPRAPSPDFGASGARRRVARRGTAITGSARGARKPTPATLPPPWRARGGVPVCGAGPTRAARRVPRNAG
jgi:hypothetical protein